MHPKAMHKNRCSQEDPERERTIPYMGGGRFKWKKEISSKARELESLMLIDWIIFNLYKMVVLDEYKNNKKLILKEEIVWKISILDYN